MVQVRNADSLDRMVGGRKVKKEIDSVKKCIIIIYLKIHFLESKYVDE